MTEKSKWWPATRTGRLAVWYGVAAVVWGVLFPNFIRFLSGFFMVALEVVLVIMAFFYSIRAVFREKERNLLSFVVFGLLCLVGGFWLLFALGEVLVPH
ncbi:MAG: hypothetical protein ABH838_00240 [Actinomycetota bacterium]